MAETYRAAGVDLATTDAWLASLRRHLSAIGGFGGVFALGDHIAGMSRPCLVAAADGVGTKLLVARAAGDLSTVGVDCVAMVVNDLICVGARPLFFLDYLAVGRFDEGAANEVMEGLQRGCEEAGCEILGGETAELPGLLRTEDFDICGFGVGVVDRDGVIDGARITAGDAVIGLPSSGLHSNGFSLVRRVLPEYESDFHLARELLTPTRIHVKDILTLIEAVLVKGIAHITGGGLPGNLGRTLQSHTDARLDPSLWERPAIFDLIAERGAVSAGEMFRTFNMGIGMCVIVGAADAEAAIRSLAGCAARQIGEVVSGQGQVHIEGVSL